MPAPSQNTILLTISVPSARFLCELCVEALALPCVKLSKRLLAICHIFVSSNYHPTPARLPASNCINWLSCTEKSVAVHETFANFLRLYW
jgi:hypothetical protein